MEVNVRNRPELRVRTRPGAARIAIGVLDATTKLTGFQTVEVAAPVSTAGGG